MYEYDGVIKKVCLRSCLNAGGQRAASWMSGSDCWKCHSSQRGGDVIDLRNLTHTHILPPPQKKKKYFSFAHHLSWHFIPYIMNVCLPQWNLTSGQGGTTQLCIFKRKKKKKITESLEDSRTPPVTPCNVKHGCTPPQLPPNAGAGE